MAMQPLRWSVSALSVEFGIDRRTVAKRLAGIEPAGMKNGSPVYRLAEATRALELPPPERGMREPQGIHEAIRESARLDFRCLFAYGAPVVRLLMTRGMDAAKAIALTLELWEVFEDQARQALDQQALLRGLPVALAKPEARESLLAELKKEARHA